MRRVTSFLLLVWTAGCAPDLAPTDESAVIEVTLATPWEISTTTLYPDDVLTMHDASPYLDNDGVQKVYHTARAPLRDGTFDAAKARVLAHPAGRERDPGECAAGVSEHATLRIRYTGPDTTRALHSEMCQEGPIGDLWDDLYALRRQNGAAP